MAPDSNSVRHDARAAGRKFKLKMLNVPNTLSLVRVFLAPLVLLFLSLGAFGLSTPITSILPIKFYAAMRELGADLEIPTLGDLLAGIVFIIAAVTDSLDGYIARKHRLVTNLGKFIDPLADKVLVIAAMIALVDLHRIPAWIVLVIITREFVVTGLRLVAAAEGIVIAASKGGKLKTIFQIIALSMLILKVPGGMLVMWIAMILTIWSGMVYLINGSKILVE